MACHVCSRASTSRLKYLCPSCARNQLYQLRIENARILLENESLGQQINNAVSSTSILEALSERPGSEHLGLEDEDHIAWPIQSIANEKAKSSLRIKLLESRTESLRLEIKNKKRNISEHKLALAQRRSDAGSAKYQLAERETAILSGIHNSAKRTDHLWHSLHSKTAEARIFLCREAAYLYNLQQKVKKKDGKVKETYTVGATPSQISTSFSYIAQLLVLVSHYLSLRLPAEITLPHRNYPTPTIYTPSGSYLVRETLPVSSTLQPSPSNSTSSRTADPRSCLPRPRPLSIDRSLPKLAKEDPGTYALFIEGATLLAWNISWLCRTQGLHITSDSWEEICSIGKHMWQLLVAPPAQTSTLVRAFAGRDVQPKVKITKDPPKTIIQRTKSFPMLGHYSHGTVHSFLAASEGTEFMRTWRLPTPTKVADKLKSSLLGEMASAEWEVLEKKEWDNIPEAPLQSVHESSINREGEKCESDISNMEPSENNRAGPASPNEPIKSNRLKGTSGWTKLRNSALELSAYIPEAVLRAELHRRSGVRDSDNDKPLCGSKDRGVYNTPVHVMALFLILVLSTLACSFPVLARRFPRLPIPRRFLFLSRHFGTGVLIATAFVHLLPTAFVSLTDPCLPRFWNESYRAMAGFVAMVSVFVVVVVEMFFAMKGAGHVHGSEYDHLISDVGGDTASHYQNEEPEYLQESTENIHLEGMPDGSCTSSLPQSSGHLLSDSTDDGSQSQSASLIARKEDVEVDLEGPDSYDDSRMIAHRSPYSQSELGRPSPAISRGQPGTMLSIQNPQRQLLQCLLLEAGILFHSIFIGMALSVATGTSFVVLLVAICFHQTFEGFALGSRIASLIPDLFAPSSMKPWLMSLAYGTTTPIGQAIGLILHNLYDPTSTAGLLMVGITNAISSGLLLFAGLVELLAEDFLSESSYATLQGRKRVEACIAVACGALLMALVGAFA
ncbi:UV radiation resistance protein and autophagy-related subunit 14-domain-containing protein [Aspergillus tamarii]|uniref:Autophagy-related protein 14 n=1 Tax=Aspergillus tamarii TaxID=41984 RepID=A0A5N6UCM8_ASPTM|nr:UV radiation resistance protein and autophagy-related subunit 14-domain-containing protein [Aspergillus tamarii]